MHIVLMAHGHFAHTPLEEAALARAERIIAADGGAQHVLMAGRIPHLVVGDMDSIATETMETLRAQSVPMHIHPRHKDETDLELALRAADSATEITILGALGGRRDHEWANMLLLAQAPCPARILHQACSIFLVDNRRPQLTLQTMPEDTVSLIPLTDVHGVTLTGLAYPLTQATLPLGTPRGVSNVALETCATISLTNGRMLVMHLSRAYSR